MPIEVLIHNVGHHDLWPLIGDAEAKAVKVKAVKIHSFASRVHEGIEGGLRWAQKPSMAPGVMSFESGEILRGVNHSYLDEYPRADDVEVSGVCIAILPAVLQAWLDLGRPDADRELVLLYSGYTRSVAARGGEATEATAKVLSRWVRDTFPELRVRVVQNKEGHPFHLSEDAAEHDEVVTVLTELRARASTLAELARSSAKPGERVSDDWKDYLSMTLSASTGTDAVQWTLVALLLPYRAKSLHVPTARGAPDLKKPHLVYVVSSDALNASPSRAYTTLPTDLRALRDEMARWRDEYARALQEPGQELGAFWLRKTNKPVLAVLLVRRGDETLVFHRGCNLEVSMPTGSLCAERNAVGSALAATPSLARRDIVGVAVFSPTGRNPLDPCGACREWLTKIAEASPMFRVLTFADDSLERVFVRHSM